MKATPYSHASPHDVCKAYALFGKVACLRNSKPCYLQQHICATLLQHSYLESTIMFMHTGSLSQEKRLSNRTGSNESSVQRTAIWLTWHTPRGYASHMRARRLWDPRLPASRAAGGLANPACLPCSARERAKHPATLLWRECPLQGRQTQDLHGKAGL